MAWHATCDETPSGSLTTLSACHLQQLHSSSPGQRTTSKAGAVFSAGFFIGRGKLIAPGEHEVFANPRWKTKLLMTGKSAVGRKP